MEEAIREKNEHLMEAETKMSRIAQENRILEERNKFLLLQVHQSPISPRDRFMVGVGTVKKERVNRLIFRLN